MTLNQPELTQLNFSDPIDWEVTSFSDLIERSLFIRSITLGNTTVPALVLMECLQSWDKDEIKKEFNVSDDDLALISRFYKTAEPVFDMEILVCPIADWDCIAADLLSGMTPEEIVKSHRQTGVSIFDVDSVGNYLRFYGITKI